MIRDQDLDAAVARGILTGEQAAQLRALAFDGASNLPEADVPADPDDERFRLIGGFNDVFVTIGVGLLATALIGLASPLGIGAWITLPALAAAWALSEIFTTRMRLALPSIALVVMFAISGAYLAGMLGSIAVAPGVSSSRVLSDLESAFGGLGLALAAFIHQQRFRVPISTAIIAGGLVWAFSALLAAFATEWSREHSSLMMAIYGTLVFGAALWFDARDPERKTRNSDRAFWLHMLASPMLVHVVMPLVAGSQGERDAVQSLSILSVFALIAIVALVIDRRALLVSGLIYAGGALTYLLSKGVHEGLGTALSLLGLAAVVLGLSLGWRPLRAALIPLLPLAAVRRFIPPVDAPSLGRHHS